jgi:hypothetical protein
MSNNISLNKEDIQLNVGRYLVVDALYLNEIKEYFKINKVLNSIDDIRKLVFPYTNSPFAEYNSENAVFCIIQIKKIDVEKVDICEKKCFSVDSGLILFLQDSVLYDFLYKYDFEELVESNSEIINMKYWESLVASFDFKSIAAIVSPGIDSGFEFDGSGIYCI